MRAVCDKLNWALALWLRVVQWKDTKSRGSAPPSQSFPHLSSSNYLFYWFRSAPGVPTQGPVLQPILTLLLDVIEMRFWNHLQVDKRCTHSIILKILLTVHTLKPNLRLLNGNTALISSWHKILSATKHMRVINSQREMTCWFGCEEEPRNTHQRWEAQTQPGEDFLWGHWGRNNVLMIELQWKSDPNTCRRGRVALWCHGLGLPSPVPCWPSRPCVTLQFQHLVVLFLCFEFSFLDCCLRLTLDFNNPFRICLSSPLSLVVVVLLINFIDFFWGFMGSDGHCIRALWFSKACTCQSVWFLNPDLFPLIQTRTRQKWRRAHRKVKHFIYSC